MNEFNESDITPATYSHGRSTIKGVGEIQTCLLEWNRTAREFPRDKSIHQLFEAQAEQTPEAVAIVCEEESMSYRELNGRANQLAKYLSTLGVGPDVLVGVCTERSLEMIIGLLAILKAGGAYVPLDPEYPKERLIYMVEEAAMPVLLTQRRITERLPQSSARLVWLDEFPWELEPNNPPTIGGPESLAYVIYTSGSTGIPKGVEIPHRALVNCVYHFRESLGVSADDIWLAITTLSFDIAGLEIWLPLTTGARCVIALRETARDARLLSQALLDHGATILQATPVTWRMLLLAEWKGNPKLQLLCGGEAMPQDLADQLAVLGSAAWNVYGPTETTIWSTSKKLAPDEPVNIGRPMANTQLYILDSQGQLVPAGEEGDLFIGGVGVARGYRNRPELTAEKFIPNPFAPQSGARIYNTGDRARWRTDGSVDLLGRADFQVKIRGFRIELGDIEAALRTQPAVQEAVAMVREDSTGIKLLVAYLVAADGAFPEATALTKFLKEKLPEYMIPSLYFVLPALPLTPNGKVDRKALEHMECAELPTGIEAEDSSINQPKDLLELELIRIWQQLFHRHKVDRTDNFFDLGGNSLLAAKLTTVIEEMLGTKLAIAAMFQSPTIESLAHRLTEEEWVPPWSSLVPLQPLGSKPPLFLVHGWGGDVYGFLGLAQLLAPDHPSFGIQAVGLDGKVPRHDSVSSMAAHYVQEIRSFQPNGPYFVGGYSSGGVIAYEVARLLQRYDNSVASLILLDSDPIGMISRTIIPYVFSRVVHHARRRLTRKAAVENVPQEKPAFGDYYHALTLAHRLESYSGDVAVFVSEETSPESAAAWRYLIRGGISYHQIQGKHKEFIEPSCLPDVALTIKSVLDSAMEKREKERSV